MKDPIILKEISLSKDVCQSFSNNIYKIYLYKKMFVRVSPKIFTYERHLLFLEQILVYPIFSWNKFKQLGVFHLQEKMIAGVSPNSL